MRVKEFKGLMRVEIAPISREKALAMLRGERRFRRFESRCD
jgi:hypothetical protein